MDAENSGAVANDERECPFCAETVKRRAKLCKHCGRDLPQVELPSIADQIESLIGSARPITENTDSPESLCGATWQGDWALVKDLLAKGGDPRVPNEAGDTALDLACARGYEEIVRLFLMHAVAVDQKPAVKDLSNNQELKASNLAPSATPKKGNSGWVFALSILFAIGWAVYYFGGGLNKSVALDFEKRYEIAKDGGANSVEMCVHAGMVAAAYLQAHDDSKYRQWRGIEKIWCDR